MTSKNVAFNGYTRRRMGGPAGSARTLTAGLLAAGIALSALAACGSGSADTTTPARGGGTARLPAGTAATGEPVRIGFVSNEGGSAVSQVDVRFGAEAATKYANDHLGGIAGRPIELVVCKEQEDPGSARACATKMIEAKVVAVVMSTTALGDSMAPVITGAGIPYVSVSGASAAEFTSDRSFLWSGSFPGALGAMAKYASEHHIASVDLAVIDAGAVTGTVKALGQPVFDKAGVELRLTAIAPGTPDASAPIAAAVASHPGAFAIVGDETHCIAVLKALQTAAAKQPRMIIQACVGKTVEDAAPGTLDGALLFTFADVYSDDPDSVLYRTVMATYAPKTPVDGFAVTGYQDVLGLVRGLSGLHGTVTTETTSAALRAAKAVPLPAGHGISFTCDKKAVPILAAVCGASALVTPIAGTRGTTFTVVDASPLFAR
ncbi:ABC transporter substrate-binding protein [Frankia gtarii]|uniref:ABC transporter substrate-binding protein n=1 Tax=Frankia gtarii TaxID=2950102 RepID=UPI0021C0A96E|nr:ABC transporter substrate-binding protein [Frankia gtarii]